jgi:acetolactate synthase-1/2/3 large subunit
MRVSRVLLEMLKAYGVKHVFGFPGETTLPWYIDWLDFPEITHVLARDERSAAFMADAYARASFRPGICESPGVGATHLLPGVAEAYAASVPVIYFTSDISTEYEGMNMLTAIDQTSLFKGLTKETITIREGSEVPDIMRRAFRLATTNRAGPVHINIPENIFEDDVVNPYIYAESEFANYPGHRSVAEMDKVEIAIELLSNSKRPVIICGQGVLYSQASDEVTELAELLEIPVGTTITGKGSIAEDHPLSIGVIGSRGGTSFSNGVVDKADLIFYIGSNTDSVGTINWTLPPVDNRKKIVHLDINKEEIGKTYSVDIALVGDARATLRELITTAKKTRGEEDSGHRQLAQSIQAARADYDRYVSGTVNSDSRHIHPIRLLKELTRVVPGDTMIVADPGVSAIYTSAFYKLRKSGRNIMFNYSMGALGYAVPAAVGAYFARPESCIIALTGDGSFGFTAGELETIARIGGNINIILFNNGCLGWIKAALRFSYDSEGFATDFKDVDYVRIAEGFGLKAFRAEKSENLGPVLQEALSLNGPTFVEVRVQTEDELVPPVPSWVRKARGTGKECAY